MAFRPIQVRFKPIVMIDPEKSRAAQAARRGPGLIVKFPPLDFNNLPSWPPLSGDEDDEEDDRIGEESSEGQSEVEERSSTWTKSPDLNEPRPRSPSHDLSATCETPWKPQVDPFSTFIPAKREIPVVASRVPRNAFVPNASRNDYSRNGPLNYRAPSPSTILPPRSNSTQSFDRLEDNGGDIPSHSDPPDPMAEVRASRLGLVTETSFDNTVDRARHSSFCTLIQNESDSSSNIMASVQEANVVSQATVSPASSPIPRESLNSAPTQTRMTPQEAPQHAERSLAIAAQSTFRMAMALSKPYQPGQYVPNYPIFVFAEGSTHQGFRQIPDQLPGVHNAVPVHNEGHFVDKREPRTSSETCCRWSRTGDPCCPRHAARGDSLVRSQNPKDSYRRHDIPKITSGLARDPLISTDHGHASRDSQTTISTLDGEVKKNDDGQGILKHPPWSSRQQPRAELSQAQDKTNPKRGPASEYARSPQRSRKATRLSSSRRLEN